MKFQFMPATRKKAKARIALAGPSGSGKTYTALTQATHLLGVRTVGEGRRKIAVIDTERESSALYAADPKVPDETLLEEGQAGGFGFSALYPVRFDPRELVAMIDAAADGGYEALIIDSLSHYWNGSGGFLQLVEEFRRKSSSNRAFAGWDEAVKIVEKPMIEAMLGYPGHVIACMRSKQHYAIDEVDQGNGRTKTEITKLGLKPEQRDGIEYEFTVVGDMDMNHYLRITKTRCSALDEAVIHKPGPELANTLTEWLEKGEPPKYVDWAAELLLCQSQGDLNALWDRATYAGVGRLLRNDFAARKAALVAEARQVLQDVEDEPSTSPEPQTSTEPVAAGERS